MSPNEPRIPVLLGVRTETESANSEVPNNTKNLTDERNVASSNKFTSSIGAPHALPKSISDIKKEIIEAVKTEENEKLKVEEQKLQDEISEVLKSQQEATQQEPPREPEPTKPTRYERVLNRIIEQDIPLFREQVHFKIPENQKFNKYDRPTIIRQLKNITLHYHVTNYHPEGADLDSSVNKNIDMDGEQHISNEKHDATDSQIVSSYVPFPSPSEPSPVVVRPERATRERSIPILIASVKKDRQPVSSSSPGRSRFQLTPNTSFIRAMSSRYNQLHHETNYRFHDHLAAASYGDRIVGYQRSNLQQQSTSPPPAAPEAPRRQVEQQPRARQTVRTLLPVTRPNPNYIEAREQPKQTTLPYRPTTEAAPSATEAPITEPPTYHTTATQYSQPQLYSRPVEDNLRDYTSEEINPFTEPPPTLTFVMPPEQYERARQEDKKSDEYEVPQPIQYQPPQLSPDRDYEPEPVREYQPQPAPLQIYQHQAPIRVYDPQPLQPIRSYEQQQPPIRQYEPTQYQSYQPPATPVRTYEPQSAPIREYDATEAPKTERPEAVNQYDRRPPQPSAAQVTQYERASRYERVQSYQQPPLPQYEQAPPPPQPQSEARPNHHEQQPPAEQPAQPLAPQQSYDQQVFQHRPNQEQRLQVIRYQSRPVPPIVAEPQQHHQQNSPQLLQPVNTISIPSQRAPFAARDHTFLGYLPVMQFPSPHTFPQSQQLPRSNQYQSYSQPSAVPTAEYSTNVHTSVAQDAGSLPGPRQSIREPTVPLLTIAYKQSRSYA